jgi:Regulator of chromosome condensation (RCC1) repeat
MARRELRTVARTATSTPEDTSRLDTASGPRPGACRHGADLAWRRRPLPRIATVVALACAAASLPGVAAAAVATQVTAGFRHACAIDTLGGVSCWGLNDLGQVGDGSTIDRSTPVGVAGLAAGVASVDAGTKFTCAVTTGGAAKCWGSNGLGYLGDGTTSDSSTPVDVAGLGSGVASIAAGTLHACAVMIAGGVKCWGWDGYGQLGDGTPGGPGTTPTDVVGLTDAVAVTTGAVHSCALTSVGGVKCWGYNAHGELGDGTTTDSAVPVDVVGLASGVIAIDGGSGEQVIMGSYFPRTCALTSSGGVKCWGTGFGSTPTDLPGFTSDIAAISLAGNFRGLALTSGGGARDFATGGDVAGLSSDIAAVSQGFSNECVLTAAGEVKCSGQNTNGQLGEGNTDFLAGGVPGCVVGFGDSDFDRICDSADPCSGGQVFIAARKPSLVLSRIAEDPTLGDDRLRLHGRFPLPPGVSFADLDLIADGARLTLVDPGGLLIDRVLSAGAYGGRGTAGWFINGSGKTWRFIDATTSPVSTRMQLTDKGNGAPGGEVDLTLTRSQETIPFTVSDALPQAIVVLGDAAAGSAGRCVQSDYVAFGPECTFNKRQTNLSCRVRR